MADIQVLDFNKYMKKPVEVQAAELTEEAWETLHNNCINHVMRIRDRQLAASMSDDGKEKYFLVDTLEGVMKGDIGDMLIIGVKGEIYPCKPDIFSQTYTGVWQ